MRDMLGRLALLALVLIGAAAVVFAGGAVALVCYLLCVCIVLFSLLLGGGEP